MIGWPNLIRRIQSPAIWNYLRPNKGDKILEIGCGGGYLAWELIRTGCEVSAIDIQIPGYLKEGVITNRNLSLVEEDFSKAKFGKKKFDKVVISSVIQMVKNDKDFLIKIRQLLKPKGIVVGSVPIEYFFLQKWLGLKKSDFRKKFQSRGRQFYTKNSLHRVVEESGLRMEQSIYAPGRSVSRIIEAWWWVKGKLGLKLMTWWDALLLPIFRFWQFEDKKSGSELVFLLRKR